jgi:glycosyltransferase involved in cell wall biosynthesis
MKIAIDLTQIPADKTGVGIYALNLVREMCKINNDSKTFQFLFFVQDDDETFTRMIKNAEHTTLIPVKHSIFRKMLPRFIFEQFILPHTGKKENVKLIFSPHYTIPYFTRIKRIVAFHDTTFYHFPKLHQKIKRLYFKSLIPLSIKKSSAIISVSQSTKDDLLNCFKKINPEKISVIHHGVEAIKDREKEMESTAEGVMNKFELSPQKYILFIGTLEPRKNIKGLLQSFHSIRESNSKVKNEFKLVIVGKKGWFYKEIFEITQKLHLEEAVVFTGYVDEVEKQALLLKAFLFVYPSFYEGFGIPVLEAMACGIPVITGNVSALPEVAGNAAIFINPNDRGEISTAMSSVLTDQALYEILSQKGPEQAKKFSWVNTASKTLELIEKVAKDNA